MIADRRRSDAGFYLASARYYERQASAYATLGQHRKALNSALYAARARAQAAAMIQAARDLIKGIDHAESKNGSEA